MHELLEEAEVPSKIILDSAIGYIFIILTFKHTRTYTPQFYNGRGGPGDSRGRRSGREWRSH